MIMSDDADDDRDAAACGCAGHEQRERRPRAPASTRRGSRSRRGGVVVDAGFLERVLHCGSLRSGRSTSAARARARPGPLRERRRPHRTFPVPCVEHLVDDSAIAVHGMRPVEERLDRHLVGAAEHRRGAAAGPAGLVGERAGTGTRRGRAARTSSVPERRSSRSAPNGLGEPRRARRARGRSGGACRASRAARWWRRRRTRPCRARPTAGARRPRSGRSRRRTARGPRSPRGPCS